MTDSERITLIRQRIAHHEFLLANEPITTVGPKLAELGRHTPGDLKWLVDEHQKMAKKLQTAKVVMEGVLAQSGYTALGAFEAVEDYLKVSWDGERQAFVYSDGTEITH